MAKKNKSGKTRDGSGSGSTVQTSGSSTKLRRSDLWVVIAGQMPSYGDQVIESPGQIIVKKYLRNDEILLRRRYVRPLAREDEYRKCDSCGRRFLGSITSGPYRSHRERARHDQEPVDLDQSVKSPKAAKPRSAAGENPDKADGEGAWDLEEGDSPPVTKIEEDIPSGSVLLVRG